MNKFLSWVAGILAVVIAGWLVWYLTKPPATTTFEGMVVDAAANTAVPNAMVTVEITGAANSGSYHDMTDANGAYRIDFTGLSKSSSATVQAEAKGFRSPGPGRFPTLAVDMRHDIELTPNAPEVPGHVAVIPTPALGRRPAYIQKTLAEGKLIRIQGNP
jgi:hypothetical protein